MKPKPRIFVERANGMATIGQHVGHAWEDVTEIPMPTIQAGRPQRDTLRPGDYVTASDSTLRNGKPPYRVPLMAEIAALPWNGLTVVSTFSGCGGSCLGFEMAGYRVVWANEFVPAAQAVYQLNHPGTHLDTRDIRTVEPTDILATMGMRAGELDMLEGSPPCASFSTAGKRHKSWNQVRSYSDTKQRTDDLFFEYARLLKGLQPKVFVAENVSGLVKGVAKGYFKEILTALKGCGYRVEAQLLDAQWLGVPQARQRIIFIGIRNDLNSAPVFPTPLKYRYSVRDALPWILRQAVANDVYEDASQRDAATVLASTGRRDSSTLTGEHLSKVEVRITQQQGAPGIGKKDVDTGRPWDTVCGTQHNQFILEEDTSIARYAIGDAWDVCKPGEPSSRYFNLVKPALDAPCPTVTQTGGNLGAASVTHPMEKRKFTIAELKRICAFPDDFQLVGSYAQQWERLGRAVPPVMMFHVARTLRDEVFTRWA